MAGKTNRHIVVAIFTAVIELVASNVLGQSPGADSVVAFLPGEGAGFGQDSLPDIVLGLPRGGGVLEGSRDVLSLGVKGQITLQFTDNIIVNGPGYDFTLFENPFWIGGDSLNIYIEAAIVEVSSNGETFHQMPFDFHPEIDPPGNPLRYEGFAGVYPVMSNEGDPDPTDPLVSGGDHFDLSDVGLPNIAYVRITDTGQDTYDRDNELVSDTGFDFPPTAGFDLDAVCHVNWTSRSHPFQVLSARAIDPKVIRVEFSKTMNNDQHIPPHYFSLDEVPLDEGDEVVPVSDRLLELWLETPLISEFTVPVLHVCQHIESEAGENLLDSFDREVEIECGIHRKNGEEKRTRGALVAHDFAPNPFNRSTFFTFNLPNGGDVRIGVYDLRGKLIRTLIDGRMEMGTHRISWNGRNSHNGACPSGVYLIILEFEHSRTVRKIVYLK
jgi:hypothetical protein